MLPQMISDVSGQISVCVVRGRRCSLLGGEQDERGEQRSSRHRPALDDLGDDRSDGVAVDRRADGQLGGRGRRRRRRRRRPGRAPPRWAASTSAAAAAARARRCAALTAAELLGALGLERRRGRPRRAGRPRRGPRRARASYSATSASRRGARRARPRSWSPRIAGVAGVHALAAASGTGRTASASDEARGTTPTPQTSSLTSGRIGLGPSSVLGGGLGGRGEPGRPRCTDEPVAPPGSTTAAARQLLVGDETVTDVGSDELRGG